MQPSSHTPEVTRRHLKFLFFLFPSIPKPFLLFDQTSLQTVVTCISPGETNAWSDHDLVTEHTDGAPSTTFPVPPAEGKGEQGPLHKDFKSSLNEF